MVGTARKAAFLLQQQQGMTQTRTVHTFKYPREHWGIDTKASLCCVDAGPGQTQREALCKGQAGLPSVADTHRLCNQGLMSPWGTFPMEDLLLAASSCTSLHVAPLSWRD